MERIRIIVTGGTLDKEYDQLSGELSFTATHLSAMLEQGRCRVPTVVETVMLKDSLHMVQTDRETVLERCLASAESRILVTHGTDTMADTAQIVGRAGLPRTVVLTGAMIPWSFGNSDALFNLGTALAAVQLLPEGVWIAMNGRLFPWHDVRKNREIGEFQPLR